ncbi:hypothetical protein [Marixanthomonas spongiae]|uniref:hypothetical protein n=1 Tax=Marixanthomonas spongiae TaxID=2174845 RepID=UPI0014021BDE|nr:hypothetical protein [Marixanthomonas spongiae]
MDFAIGLLQFYKKKIDRTIKSTNLMQKDRTKAARELEKVSELKKAIRVLKTKNRNLS